MLAVAIAALGQVHKGIQLSPSSRGEPNDCSGSATCSNTFGES